ncbi:[citrate (pro-3S)-lyase] ligase [Marinilabiliaceae bacterium JC017]|nr:[citrate (pro-3S)-lyase] ligase [Marinilabiliaceae bacterium JC017]
MIVENTDFRIDEPDLSSGYDVALIKRFLIPMGLNFQPGEVDYTVILYTLNDEIIATGSYQGRTLKYVAVAPNYRETTAFALVVTHLIEKVMEHNQQVFVFTRPENIPYFEGLGFSHIATAAPLISILEFGYKGLCDYQTYLRTLKCPSQLGVVSSIVMNGNPFTKGHQYLVEKASAESGLVYLFVVEENRSVFSFDVRWELIERGTAHLPNVILVKGGYYIVSSATFPDYFLKSEEPGVITQKQTELDIRVFANCIAPVLGIQRRYVGTEEYCATTKLYNETMKDILPKEGVELVEVPRKLAEGDGGLISATKVREAIKDHKEEHLADYLPASTLDFIKSARFEPFREKILVSEKRH